MGKSNVSNKSVISRLGGQKFIVLLVVIGLIIFFSAVSPDFRKYTTFMSILDYSYYIALMAIGVTFPLITGGVDLSIGTGLICYSLTGGYLIVQKGWPVGAGMAVALLLSIAIGLLNGVLVAIMNLPPFLATLCSCMITRGLGSIFSKNFGISWPTSGTPGSWFRNIFKITINGTKIPLGFLWVVLLVVLMAFVLNHTKIGRYTIAIGSNKEATILSGINVKFYHIMAYVISGFFAGLAAIAYSAVLDGTAGDGSRIRAGGNRRRDYRRCICERRCRQRGRFSDWRIRNLSVEDRTALHRFTGELAADNHRPCADWSSSG